MESSAPSLEATLVAPSDDRSPTPFGLEYTAGMVQCTTIPSVEPETIGYLVVERIARDMRNQCVATRLRRARKALAGRFARLALPSIGCAP